MSGAGKPVEAKVETAARLPRKIRMLSRPTLLGVTVSEWASALPKRRPLIERAYDGLLPFRKGIA